MRHGLQHVADLTDQGYSRLCAGRYFGMRHPGEIYGYICAGATVASGVGPVAMNCVSDLTGSCPVGLIVVGMLTCGLICVLFLKPCGFAAHRPGAGD